MEIRTVKFIDSVYDRLILPKAFYDLIESGFLFEVKGNDLSYDLDVENLYDSVETNFSYKFEGFTEEYRQNVIDLVNWLKENDIGSQDKVMVKYWW